MLSNGEQRQLTVIASHLQEDDPQLAQRLSNGWNQPAPLGGWSGWPATLTSLVCMAVVVVGLVAANVAVVAIVMIALGANAGLWITERRPRTADVRRTGGARKALPRSAERRPTGALAAGR